MRISVLSTQWARYSIAALVNGVPHDPTPDAVAFAFLPYGVEPAAPDWTTGSWETITGPPVEYVARCLVGPGAGGKVLGKGEYTVWIRVTDSPEVPVLTAGTLQIT